ncbi:MAG: YraN family protein [Vulcanimicrobiaceae bacterium]
MGQTRGPRGRAAEDRAAAYLAANGLRIVARNFRGPGGEIDIVAVDRGTLVFVEVKQRATAGFGSALAAVDARKRRRIRTVAEDFLQFVPHVTKIRFDVLAIDGDRIRHHRGAFA